MKSIIEMYKIGRGPNTDLHCMPLMACQEISEMIKKEYSRVDHLEICLYNEFAKYYPIDKQIHKAFIDGFKNLHAPVKIKVVKIPPPAARNPHTFDIYVYLTKKGEINIMHRIIGVGAGNYIITDSKKIPKYNFKNFSEIEQYFLNHKHLSFYDYAKQFEKEGLVQKHFTKCWSLMQKVIASGLSKTGTIYLHNFYTKGMKFKRCARAIFNNKFKNESPAEKVNRLISAYTYAIGEENAIGCDLVISPTASTTCVVWGCLKYVIDTYKPTMKKLINALCGAGLLVSLIEQNASLSSDLVGCAGPMGVACGIAASVASHIIYNANITEMGSAFEMALEHCLGLICDSLCHLPIVPCIKRSASYAVRAYEIAILNNIIVKTPPLCKLDDVINTMYETGRDLVNHHKQIGYTGFTKLAKNVFIKK